MNAVEIEQAISELAEQPFDAAEFSYQFLAAFGNKATTIKQLKSGNSDQSNMDGAVLQRNHIHIATWVSLRSSRSAKVPSTFERPAGSIGCI